MNRRPLRIAAACAASVALAVAGCSSSDVGDDEQTSSEEQTNLFREQCADAVIPELPSLAPVSEGSGNAAVDTEFGEVELPVSPKAALGMYTTDVDMLVWLRYPLAEDQPIRGDSGYTTFPCYFPYDELKGINTFQNYPDYDYESILAAQPDMILNGLGYDKKVVKRLPEIAPTYSVDAFDGAYWETHFKDTATALGREQYYRDWRDLYEKRVAEVKEAIGDQSGVTVAPLSYWDDKVQIGCYAGVLCQVFEDLGLKISDEALKYDGQGGALSGEQLGKLDDIDYAFMSKEVGPAGDKDLAATLDKADKNALWSDLPFVVDDHVVGYEMEIQYGSPSAALAFLDIVEETFKG